MLFLLPNHAFVFGSTYSESGLPNKSEPVPFRLTRNLTTALSPTLIDGLFSAVMMSTNACLLINQELLENYLSLFIRDDLLSWNNIKHPVDSNVTQRAIEQANKKRVAVNTSMVLKRIHMLIPTPNPTPSAAERAAYAAANGGHMSNNPPIQPQPLNHKIHLLIKDATSEHKLSNMSAQWAPWF